MTKVIDLAIYRALRASVLRVVKERRKKRIRSSVKPHLTLVK